MCVMSMVMDHYGDKWTQPPYQPIPSAPVVPPIIWPYPLREAPDVVQKPFKPLTQEEIDEFRKLLERARQYDKDNNEPDCETDEKKKKIKAIAEANGLKIEFLD